MTFTIKLTRTQLPATTNVSLITLTQQRGGWGGGEGEFLCFDYLFVPKVRGQSMWGGGGGMI